MGLKLYSVNHRDHDLAAVECLSPHIEGELEKELIAHPGVNGVIVLSTCNRIEITLDVDEDALADQLIENILPKADGTVAVKPREFSGIDVVYHLSSLACGLESMVVGEREITGQLRHAQRRAEMRDTMSAGIITALDTAFRAARKVERETGLSGMGRSIAAIGLDHAQKTLGSYEDATVVLFGTGSYAGAAVTQLKARGCKNIYVHSASGRAEAFARGRGLKAINNEELGPVLAKTDMIVSARGTGSPTVTSKHVRSGMAQRADGQGLVVLDLAIVRDVDPEVAQIPGVTLIDLDTVRSLVPELEPMKTTRAERIVAETVAAHERREASRIIDPVIIELRAHIADLITDEMASLPQRPLQRSDVERALHRITNRLLHHPTTAAHRAGARGEADTFIDALELVSGLNFDNEEEETA